MNTSGLMQGSQRNQMDYMMGMNNTNMMTHNDSQMDMNSMS